MKLSYFMCVHTCVTLLTSICVACIALAKQFGRKMQIGQFCQQRMSIFLFAKERETWNSVCGMKTQVRFNCKMQNSLNQTEMIHHKFSFHKFCEDIPDKNGKKISLPQNWHEPKKCYILINDWHCSKLAKKVKKFIFKDCSEKSNV